MGLDFYAPQTALAPDGRRILIAWMHSWDHEAPTHRLGHLWANTMTLPRELSWENGKLLSRPAREVRSLRRDARAFEGSSMPRAPTRASWKWNSRPNRTASWKSACSMGS